jgi:transcriptional regulator with XRE-family HTH domain
MTETTKVVTIGRMALGSNVRKYRLEAGLTQEELAKRAGMEQQALSALENRDSKSSAYLVQLAQALGKTTDELMGQPSPVEVAHTTSTDVLPPQLEDLLEVIRVMHETDQHGREMIMQSTRSAAKRVVRKGRRAAGN